MRISTQQVYLNNIDNLNRTNSELIKTQEQIATGKRVLQPSDDPLAASQIIKLEQEVARTDQFQTNIDVSNRRLSLEETTLDGMFNSLVRLREITIQAGSAVLGAQDRASLAVEVDGIIDQMQGLMNTRDVQGEYLFSGFQGDQQAYAFNDATQRYEFQGDAEQRFIQIGPDNRIASTDSGETLFETVAVPALMSNAEGAIDTLTIADLDAYQPASSSGASPFTLSIDDAGLLTVASADGSDVFSQDVPAVNLSTTGITVASGDALSFNGVELTVGSVPAAGSGATFTAEIGSPIERDNVLNIALDLSRGLKNIDTGTEAGRAEMTTLLADTLTSLKSAEDANISGRTSIGARMNALEQQQLVNDEYKLYTQETLSSFQDLDYNEAISRLTLQQTTLEAAYASFSKVSGLSLFDYIR